MRLQKNEKYQGVKGGGGEGSIGLQREERDPSFAMVLWWDFWVQV